MSKARIGKAHASLLLSLIAILALTACGQEDGDGDDQATADGSEDAAMDGEEEEADEEGASSDNPYEGETITFLVGYGEGGGFDRLARFITPYLEDALDVRVDIENMGGGGGLLALNELINAREPDGNTIMMLNGTGITSHWLAGGEGMHFDYLDDVAFIARASADPVTWSSSAASPYVAAEDVFDAGSFGFAAGGGGSANYVSAHVLLNVFGLDGEVITGYDGQDIAVAVIRGEHDGRVGNLQEVQPSAEAGDEHLLAIIGHERHDAAPDVPTVLEFEEFFDHPEAEVLLESNMALYEIFRILVTQAEVPTERLEALENAIVQIYDDPDFHAAAEDEQLDVGHMSGEELKATIEELAQETPSEYIELLQVED